MKYLVILIPLFINCAQKDCDPWNYFDKTCCKNHRCEPAPCPWPEKHGKCYPPEEK